MGSKLFKKILYIVLILAQSVMSASAMPFVVTNYNDYKVDGRNIQEVKHSIRENSVHIIGDHSFAAKTNYKIWWNPEFIADESGCMVKSVAVLVSVTYNMPALVNSHYLTNEERNEWHKYYRALKLHERGHAKFGIWAAEEIEWTIANMIPQQDCEQMEADANAIGIKILHKYHNENLRYDSATNHGHKQGAIL